MMEEMEKKEMEAFSCCSLLVAAAAELVSALEACRVQ